MTTTTELPLTLQDLQALLPEPPADTTVTRAAAALDRISAESAAVTAALAELDDAERAAATQLADAAERGAAELAKAIAKIGADNRPVLEHRHAVLAKAWTLAHVRHAAAEATDPQHVACLLRREELTSEWTQVMANDDEAARFADLVAFTQRLG